MWVIPNTLFNIPLGSYLHRFATPRSFFPLFKLVPLNDRLKELEALEASPLCINKQCRVGGWKRKILNLKDVDNSQVIFPVFYLGPASVLLLDPKLSDLDCL